MAYSRMALILASLYELPAAFSSACFLSTSAPTRYTPDSMAKALVAIMPSFCFMAPNCAIGWLNCMRCVVYSTIFSNPFFMPPTPPAAILIRPLFNMFSAMLNPFPRSPNKFSFGTLQLLKNTCTVLDALIPIFFSSLPNSMPPNPFSTIKAESFSSLSILANTVNTSAKPPLVIHIF